MTSVHVYSLSTRTWRDIVEYRESTIRVVCSDGFHLVEGIMNFRTFNLREQSSPMVLFDVNDEVFRYMQLSLPCKAMLLFTKRRLEYWILITRNIVWEMEKTWASESWHKLYTIGISLRLLCFTENGEFMLSYNKGEVVVYDVGSGEVKYKTERSPYHLLSSIEAKMESHEGSPQGNQYYLPIELVTEVCVRLPVKSLLRFRATLGLFSYTKQTHGIMLWNPSIRKVRELPPLCVDHRVYFGLGYSRSSNDYKVVAIATNIRNSVQICSLSNPHWRGLDHYREDIIRGVDSDGVFIDGYIYWISSRNSITSFDVNDEVFNYILLPVEQGSYHNFWRYPTVYRGLLGLLEICSQGTCSLWAMTTNTDRVLDSWSKLYTIDFQAENHPLSILYVMNGKMIFVKKNGVLALYDFDSKQLRNLLQSHGSRICYLSLYKESLMKKFARELPTELATEVLARLPVKSLVRLRCVCKAWCSLISSPDFASLHLDRYHNHDDHTLVLAATRDSHRRLQGMLLCGQTHDKLVNDGYAYAVLNSQRIMDRTSVQVDSPHTCSWKDVTDYRESIIRALEPHGFVLVEGMIHFISNNSKERSCHMVMFDVNDEMFSYVELPPDLRGPDNRNQPVIYQEKIGIFSVDRSNYTRSLWLMKSDRMPVSWSRVYKIDLPADFIAGMLCFKKNGQFVLRTGRGVQLYDMESGEVKHLTHYYSYRIVYCTHYQEGVLELERISFSYVELPPELSGPDNHNQPVIYREKIGIFGVDRSNYSCSLWLMKSDGMRGSWSRVYKIDLPADFIAGMRCFKKDGQFMLHTGKGVQLYDMESGEVKHLTHYYLYRIAYCTLYKEEQSRQLIGLLNNVQIARNIKNIDNKDFFSAKDIEAAHFADSGASDHMFPTRMEKSSCELPMELVTEVLVRLPVMSLLRFRCVCKAWCSLISSPDFASLHLSHYHNDDDNPPFLTVMQILDDYLESYWMLLSSDTYERRITGDDYAIVDRRLRRGGLEYSFAPHGSSVNGLVLWSRESFGSLSGKQQKMLMLWNPMIRRAHELPTQYPPFPTCWWPPYFGLGFSHSRNDYKVVAIVKEAETSKTSVHVYSLSTCTWRTIVEYREDIIDQLHSDGQVLIEGAIHFVSSNLGEQRSHMVWFDVDDEVFTYIKLPAELELQGQHIYPVVYRENIGILNVDDFNQLCSLWVMENDRVAGSWSKVYTVDIQVGPIDCMLCFKKNGQFMFNGAEGTVMYDFESGEVKKIEGLPGPGHAML
ncbi:hypothetical protein Cgig2_002124 [Carnegiea gigantea]|uniref:F-box domain-containing protein n=1 Tax=Carnegiea gigantea TaxID=171969 RepID=A0A9Q1KVF6_9CARY|nr:hypothetical protein Cgig2_002124 [Carnegiea gigantea]